MACAARVGLVPWFLLAVAAGCSRPAQDGLQVLSGPTMGSSYEVKWYGAADPAAVRAAVDAELDVAQRTFDTWGRDSELARFNAHRSSAPFAASELLRGAVALALELAIVTDGAFDPTVQPLSDLYRAAKAAPSHAVDDAALAAARARIGWQRLHVVGEALQKDAPDLEVDLDGLVAGLCADRIGERLRGLGVPGFMLQITGEVLCRGCRPDGDPWRIGILDPESAAPGHEAALVSMPLLDRALCTSGSYRNFVVQGGNVRSHVFDPRTGGDPAHGVVSVSVLARSCALADGLGTALMVTGAEAAATVLARCREPALGAWFVLADGDGRLRSEPVAWPEAFALDGRPLARRELPAAQRQVAERALAAAAAAASASPDDAGALVRHARRLADFGRWRDAVAVLSAGLERHADEPRLLCERGRCAVVQREFAAAERDLAQAAAALRGRPDQLEPEDAGLDVWPPHATLQFAVHCQLGCARFVRGDFAGAAVAWRDSLAAARSGAAKAAAAQWLWCALARQGRTAAAALAVAGVDPDLDVPDPVDRDLCRLYRGELDAALLAAAPAARGAAGARLRFGLAHYRLVQGDRQGARSAFAALAAEADWAAVAVVAAEAELRRDRSQ